MVRQAYNWNDLHFRNLTRNQTVLLTHGDSVNTLGEQLDVMGYTSNQIVAAISCEQLKIYGVQFHPEVSYYYESYTSKNQKTKQHEHFWRLEHLSFIPL